MKRHTLMVAVGVLAVISISAPSRAQSSSGGPDHPLLFGYMETVVHSYDFGKGGEKVKDIRSAFFGGAQNLRLWNPGKYTGGRKNRKPETQLLELKDLVKIQQMTITDPNAAESPKVNVKIKKSKALPGYLFYTVDAPPGNWELKDLTRGGPKGTNFYRIEASDDYEDFIKLMPSSSVIALHNSPIVMAVSASMLNFGGAYRVNESANLVVPDPTTATFQTVYSIDKLEDPSEQTLLQELLTIRDLQAYKTTIEGQLSIFQR